MDAPNRNRCAVLAVDLDGTLVATDLLWEGLFQLLRQYPLLVFMVPYWAFRGPARLKHEIVSRVDIEPETLPYRSEVLERIHVDRMAGRTIVLATGTHERWARAIAAHLGLFDEVLATDETGNFTARRKAHALCERFGDGAFAYMGNSKADLRVFDAAGEVVAVAPDRHAAGWVRRNDGTIIAERTPSGRDIRKMLRVHQWLKNTLIVIPVVLAHEYADLGMMLACLVAFFAFSFAASSVYIMNDLFDLSLDRAHPTKRERPLAAGRLSVEFGFVSYGLLLGASLFLASFLDIQFVAVLLFYIAVTTAYSFAIKRMLLLDVFTLAGLYTLRIIGGAAATGVAVSFWLLAFSIFFFLSLALVKRYVELSDGRHLVGERIAGRGYRVEDQAIVSMSGVASGFASATVLALYIHSDAVADLYATPWMIWPLAPIVLYIVMRIWVLAHRNEMHDDPIVFIMSDWRSQLVAGLGFLLLVSASLPMMSF